MKRSAVARPARGVPPVREEVARTGQTTGQTTGQAVLAYPRGSACVTVREVQQLVKQLVKQLSPVREGARACEKGQRVYGETG